MTSPEWSLQKAVVSALSADVAVQGALGDPARIYDEPPDEVIFPYATFGQSETRPADGDAAPMHEHVLSLHVWSRYGGRREAKETVGLMREALHGAPLDLASDGWRLVNLRATFADVFRVGDGRTTRGMLRLRAVTEPLSS
ncbi:MAG: DUF3168 domain-containing protein [Caulobacterales bacterium]|nr:DUF3168 domain-containing protein [Caulobacterales bacterium]